MSIEYYNLPNFIANRINKGEYENPPYEIINAMIATHTMIPKKIDFLGIIISGRLDYAKKILEAGYDIDSPQSYYFYLDKITYEDEHSSLMACIKLQDEKSAQWLIDNNAEPFHNANSINECPLQLSIDLYDEGKDFFSMFLKKDIDMLNTRMYQYDSVLEYCNEHSRLCAVKIISHICRKISEITSQEELQYKFDLEYLLYHAIEYKMRDQISILVKSGADADEQIWRLAEKKNLTYFLSDELKYMPV